MSRDFLDYLNDMTDAAEKALRFVKGLSLNDFLHNDEKEFAVTRCLEIVGEAARHIPEDIQERYPEIPWADMIGMRNIMIHGYFGIDKKVLWRTVQDDLPQLLINLKRVRAETSVDEE